MRVAVLLSWHAMLYTPWLFRRRPLHQVLRPPEESLGCRLVPQRVFRTPKEPSFRQCNASAVRYTVGTCPYVPLNPLAAVVSPQTMPAIPPTTLKRAPSTTSISTSRYRQAPWCDTISPLVSSPGNWPWSSRQFYNLQDASVLRMDSVAPSSAHEVPSGDRRLPKAGCASPRGG